jgi:transposase
VRTSFFGQEDGTMPGSRYDASTRAKAVRLVREHAGDYPTQWAAIKAVSGRLGMSTETLRKWLRQAEVDEGAAAGVTSAESAEIRELRRKNRELEQTIEILKAAASFFARECDPRQR